MATAPKGCIKKRGPARINFFRQFFRAFFSQHSLQKMHFLQLNFFHKFFFYSQQMLLFTVKPVKPVKLKKMYNAHIQKTDL